MEFMQVQHLHVNEISTYLKEHFNQPYCHNFFLNHSEFWKLMPFVPWGQENYLEESTNRKTLSLYKFLKVCTTEGLQFDFIISWNLVIPIAKCKEKHNLNIQYSYTKRNSLLFCNFIYDFKNYLPNRTSWNKPTVTMHCVGTKRTDNIMDKVFSIILLN